MRRAYLAHDCSRGRAWDLFLCIKHVGDKKNPRRRNKAPGNVGGEVYLFCPGTGIGLTGILASKLRFFGRRERSDFKKSSHLSFLPV